MPNHILLTNDDGIESGFLHTIARALSTRFRVSIAAPMHEQSWIGRAVSRRREVAVERREDFPWQAWAIDGTPTDCVNIALGNLLPERPDAVVSGINIGYNTSTTLIYSSGTVAGALEGAFWGLPAIAVSQEIPDEIFGEVTATKGRLTPEWQAVLDASAAHATGLIHSLLENASSPNPLRSPASPWSHPGESVVHNLNYPARPQHPLRTVRTVPVPLREMNFFRSNGNGAYNFHFEHGKQLPSAHKTDRDAIAEGEISHSILNFSALGRDLNH